MDSLFELTALPNLHPALVHFPIALVGVALLFDVVVFIRRRRDAIERSAAILWGLAAVGAAATYAAGRVAADGVGALSATAEETLASHADAALATVSALGVLALLRVWLTRPHAGESETRPGALRIVALLIAFVVQGLVAYTADLGGALVYRHGVAVSARPASTMVSAAVTSCPRQPAASSGFSRLEDGSMLWRPRSGDAVALGETLEPIGDAAVRVARRAAGTDGLSLVVSGRALLALPGSWEDVQLEIRLDSSEFEGSFALGARVEGDDTGGFFRVPSDGNPRLIVRRKGEEEVLDEAEAPLSRGEETIALSAVGRHWKGFANGDTVVHSHPQLPGVGRAALLLDGVGTIRLISVRISPGKVGKALATVHDEHEH